jgi:hypothetical protein
MIERTVEEAGRLAAEPWHRNATTNAIVKSIDARTAT